MANAVVTLSIPQELKKRMEEFSETNWSEAMLQFLQDKVHRMGVLKEMDELLKHSELTEEDVDKIGHVIKDKAWKKIKKLI